MKLILSKLQHVNRIHLKPAYYQRGTHNRLLPNVICVAPAFVLLLAFATAGRHIKATYFITPIYSINQFLEALNVCDSITNQQIDTAILLMPLSCLSIMQQHLSTEVQSIYLLSGAVTTSILHMNLSALLCHNNSSNFQRWSVKQSDRATRGFRVSYRSGTDPTCMFVCLL